MSDDDLDDAFSVDLEEEEERLDKVKPVSLQNIINSTSEDLENSYDLNEELTRKRKDGTLIREKARMIVETLGLPYLAQVLCDNTVPAQSRLAAMKLLSVIGDLEPKAIAGGSGGPQMVIQFNIPTTAERLDTQVIDTKPVTTDIKLEIPDG
ncbi:MAG: hypothetical protein QW318_09505 [Candidatus Caldarchaeum sp.]